MFGVHLCLWRVVSCVRFRVIRTFFLCMCVCVCVCVCVVCVPACRMRRGQIIGGSGERSRRLSVATQEFLKHRVKATDELPAASTKTPRPGAEGEGGDDEPHERVDKLGEFMATGICGNNITSSCLYACSRR